MLRKTIQRGAYQRLRLLYALKDPWEMATPREQYRFAITRKHIAALSPHYGTILELGCGEGHQSQMLQELTDRLYGIDVSAQAVKRARKRCPEAEFLVGNIEDSLEQVPVPRVDLICACEVLYYLQNPAAIMPVLEARANQIYVSNYSPRAEFMKTLFSRPGWRRLDDIRFDDTAWECCVWERA